MTTSVQAGSTYNIVIHQGRLFEIVFTAQDSNGTAMDLSGYSAAGQLRPFAGSNAVTAPFVITIPTPTNGEVWCSLDDSITANLKKNGVYDVKLIQPDTNAIAFIGGKYSIKIEVTP